jgi:putative FmdB family regulatory protein
MPVYEYRCIHPGCGFVQEEYRRTADDRDRAAVCRKCDGPAMVIWSAPSAVWHPTASDRFGETWGKNTRAEGRKSIAQKAAEVARAREDSPPPAPLYISGGPDDGDD